MKDKRFIKKYVKQLYSLNCSEFRIYEILRNLVNETELRIYKGSVKK